MSENDAEFIEIMMQDGDWQPGSRMHRLALLARRGADAATPPHWRPAMSDLVERLREYASDDHERLCDGRCYSCSCGYDDKRDPLLLQAAARIAQLEAALRVFTCDCTISERCAVPDNCLNFQARRTLEERT